MVKSSVQQAQQAQQAQPLQFSKAFRLGGWVLLAIVMTLGFLGYLMPGLRLNWETIASMCGF